MVASWVFPPGPMPASEQAIRPVYLGLLIGALVLTMVGRGSLTVRRVAIGLACSAVVFSSVWILVSEWESPVGADPYLAHEAAGAALLGGEDPYSDAVQFPNGSPFAPPDAVVVGYPYPPVTLVSYGLSAGFTDPRVVSVVAWLSVLGGLAWRSLKGDDEGNAAFAGFLILASAPIWPVMLYGAWTEPLHFALLAGALMLWRRHVVWSALLLGIALASKQYFIVLLPVLLLMKMERRVMRLAVAGGVAFLALVPPLLVDASTYLEATVMTPLGFEFRPDTQSLPGLMAALGVDISIPRWIWLGIIVVVGVVLGRWARSRADLTVAALLALGISFWAGLAFPNYWFLIAGLAVLSSYLAAADHENPEAEVPGTASSAAIR